MRGCVYIYIYVCLCVCACRVRKCAAVRFTTRAKTNHMRKQPAKLLVSRSRSLCFRENRKLSLSLPRFTSLRESATSSRFTGKGPYESFSLSLCLAESERGSIKLARTGSSYYFNPKKQAIRRRPCEIPASAKLFATREISPPRVYVMEKIRLVSSTAAAAAATASFAFLRYFVFPRART